MPAADVDPAIRLDRAFDALLAGTEPPDGELGADLATLRHLHVLSSLPVPDPAFVQRLKEELVGSAALHTGVIPTKEGSRRKSASVSIVPRFFAHAQNDTLVELSHETPLSPNGHVASSARPFAQPSLPRPRRWWPPLEVAAAVLVIVAVLGGYLAVTNLGRLNSRPSQLSAISAQTEGVAPDRIWIYSIGLEAPIVRRKPVDEYALIPVGSALIFAGILDEDWILIPPDSDPSVVTWRDDLAALGQGSNVVLEGHLDDDEGNPGVFSSLNKIGTGDWIDVYGPLDVVSEYEVDWTRRYPVAADREQRQEILGPTDEESLTLITNAGVRDRDSGLYPEVLIVRAHHAATRGLSTIIDSEPSRCTIEPRSAAELEALMGTFRGKPGKFPKATPPEALAGEPADPTTAAAVTVMTRTLAACLNANDLLRSYALFTDDGVARTFEVMKDIVTDPFMEFVPDFSDLPDPATPVPFSDQHVVSSVDDVRVLEDDRVLAIVEISVSRTDQTGLIPSGQPALYLFARDGDRWLIDEVIFPVPDVPAA